MRPSGRLLPVRWAVRERHNIKAARAICVDATVTKSTKPGYGFTGIIFWQQDNDNHFAYDYSPEQGVFRVSLVSKGKVLSPVDWTETTVVKQGVSQTNSLEVETKGKRSDPLHERHEDWRVQR